MAESIQRNQWVDPKLTVFGDVAQYTLGGTPKFIGAPHDGYFATFVAGDPPLTSH